MKNLLVAVMMFSVVSIANGQSSYNDSIKSFQKKYVVDLFPIIKSNTEFIQFFPINKAYKVLATVKMLVNEPPFKMITSSGKTRDAEKVAAVTFTLQGKQQKLFAYRFLSQKGNPSSANTFFIPFVDLTSNVESYGGGRYLDFNLSDIQNNQLLIDFNKAYNPYCAFTVGYNCPIPPKENTITIKVKAGEKYWKEKFQH